jgi:hypothetical protein
MFLRLLTIGAIALVLIGRAAASPEDEVAIKRLLHTAFDRPEARLVIEPVVVVGDHALAGWSQAEMGGRALLRRRGGTWSLILCSGDGIKSADALRHAGVPGGDAASLAAKLSDAEARLPKERIALFATFEGTVMMNADGSHPPVQQGQMHGAEMQAAPHGQMTHPIGGGGHH